MENSCDYSFYGCYADEVYGLFEYDNLSYSAPEVSSINRSDLYYCQSDFICNSAYYVEPSYVIYYPVIPVEYITYYSDETYYVNLPLYSGYYVPNYCLPTSAYYVTDIYPVPLNETSLTYFAVEPISSTYEEFDCGSYYFENRSYIDTYDISDDRVGEEITTCDLFYEEYPEILNDAPGDDEAKSLSDSSGLEKDTASNIPAVQEIETTHLVDNEPSSSVDSDVFEEGIDENIIKKVSLLDMSEVKRDIDETYEYGKANLYNEAIKGYMENKNMMEELEWECHSLEDILEEEEPESDSTEMDFNENVLEDPNNIDLSPDEEEGCSSTFISLSEKSKIASSEESLDKVMVETQPSVDPVVDEEKDEIDPFLELSSSEEKLDTGLLNSIEEHNPLVDSSDVEEKGAADQFLGLSLSKEKVYSEPLNETEEHHPPVDSSAVEENDTKDPFLELPLSKEKVHSEPMNRTEEHPPPLDSTLVLENPKMDSIPEHSLREEKFDPGHRSSSEECHPPVDSSLMLENCEMDFVPGHSLREEKFDSESRNSTEKVHTNMSSEDRVEERLSSDPDVLAPAPSKTIPRKKRFSRLRKFFSRMCCCGKKNIVTGDNIIK